MFPCVINFIEKRFRCAILCRVRVVGRLELGSGGSSSRSTRTSGLTWQSLLLAAAKCIRETNCFTATAVADVDGAGPGATAGRLGGPLKKCATVNQHRNPSDTHTHRGMQWHTHSEIVVGGHFVGAYKLSKVVKRFS